MKRSPLKRRARLSRTSRLPARRATPRRSSRVLAARIAEANAAYELHLKQAVPA